MATPRDHEPLFVRNRSAVASLKTSANVSPEMVVLTIGDMDPPDLASGSSVTQGSFNSLTGRDRRNAALLLLLYTLQGIPMGFAAAIPLILKEHNASFSDIAVFSISSLPFSAKLFWAPIVDSVYSERIGRRKTWLVPSQLSIGIMFIYIASYLPSWLGEDERHDIHIVPLSVSFFILYLLCATQDIAVDGWALTLLSRGNVGYFHYIFTHVLVLSLTTAFCKSYASTCNTIGQNLGFFEAFVLIIALVTPGYVSLATFTFLHGLFFIVVTACVGVLKTEAPVQSDEKADDPSAVYFQMADICHLPPVKELILVLLTWKFSAALADNVTILKIQEMGMPKEHAGTLSLLLTPVQIIVPMIVTKHTSSNRPLDLAMQSYIPRTLVGGISAFALVYFAPRETFDAMKRGEASLWDVLPFYLVLLVATALYSVFAAAMFVSQMAFFARISDPAIGGTYMTLLNTVANLGFLGSKLIVTYGIDLLTFRRCYTNADAKDIGPCTQSDSNLWTCENPNSECIVYLDGYYAMVAICLGVGLVWWIVFESTMVKLQCLRLDTWRVATHSRRLTPLAVLLILVCAMLLPSILRILK